MDIYLWEYKWDNYGDFSPITWETHAIINYFKHHLSGWWFGT
jgi:hypothetical protein